MIPPVPHLLQDSYPHVLSGSAFVRAMQCQDCFKPEGQSKCEVEVRPSKPYACAPAFLVLLSSCETSDLILA